MTRKCRINFSVKNCNYNTVAYAPAVFTDRIPKKDGQQLFSEWYLEYEDGVTTAIIPIDVIEPTVLWIRDKIITEPEWADKIHQETEELNIKYFEIAHEIRQKKLSQISDKELVEIFEKLREWQYRSHGHSISTTWFLDSDGEVYSTYLREELTKHLNSSGIEDKTQIIEYFTLLTTPTRDNTAQEEQIEFLQLLQEIQNNKAAKEIFKKEKAEDIFNKLPENIQEKIQNYHEKWCWTPYGYVGPAYTSQYYVEEIKKQINLKNITDLIKEEKNRNKKIEKQQEEVLKKINLPKDLENLFAIARDIIWLKDYRKYCMWHGMYVLDLLTREIAKRLHISHKQVNHFLIPEVRLALLEEKLDIDEINNRIKYSIIKSTPDKVEYYYGDEAVEVRESLEVEEVEVDPDQGFFGTCACPGEVEGEVKIVNSIEDVPKVLEGDVMLALTTYPAMMPAMKRAAAIVTEDGGITCHAAIVSREFKIPCVVGARKVCSLLQDGDRVKVDATNGIVKKIIS